jgi:hypothetical protein
LKHDSFRYKCNSRSFKEGLFSFETSQMQTGFEEVPYYRTQWQGKCWIGEERKTERRGRLAVLKIQLNYLSLIK